MRQGEGSGGSYRAEVGAQEGFPTNLLIPRLPWPQHSCRNTPPLPAALQSLPSHPISKDHVRDSLKAATGKPGTSRATDTRRVISPGHIQAPFRGLRGLSDRRAMPKDCRLHLEGGSTTGACCKEEGEAKCCP